MDLASGAVLAYLDHASTTPMRREALAAMEVAWDRGFGNPSGGHRVAREARRLVDEAREEVAAELGCSPGEVVFTSGGTEADNLAVTGAARGRGGKVVCSAVEHPAVLEPCRALGGAVASVDGAGRVDLDSLEELLAPGVGVVSVMLANNEVGTIQPLAAVVALVRARAPGAVIHTDAVHAVPWLDVAQAAQGADLVSISAHKFGGPKGAGALVVRERVGRLAPLVLGGGQERERRPGTEHVAGILGLAAALRAAGEERQAAVPAVARRRDRLAEGILAGVPGAVETVPRELKVAGSCHLRFPGIDSEELLVLADQSGVCASAGSACASGALVPSHVLLAMGLSRSEARSGIRLSLGWETSDAEVEHAIAVITGAVAQLGGGERRS
jgi:cysteine desulfurase